MTTMQLIRQRRYAGIFTAFSLRWERLLLGLLAISLVFFFWWLIVAFGFVNPVLVPPPERVFASFTRMVAEGALFGHIWASLWRVLQGFMLALLIAIPFGVAMGMFRIVRGMAEPLVELLRPIPPIAMIPLTILWFGIGESSKVFIIFYGAFFPILINTMAGFTQVDPVHIRAAQTLGAKRFHIFRDVVLRSAIPYMVVGARLGMGMAFVVLVAAELIASSEGLGFLINDARYRFRTDEIFLGMACIGVLGFTLNRLLVRLEKRIVSWKR